MRPLFYEFPEQSNLFAIEDEYMVSKVGKLNCFYFYINDTSMILQVFHLTDITSYKSLEIFIIRLATHF